MIFVMFQKSISGFSCRLDTLIIDFLLYNGTLASKELVFVQTLVVWDESLELRRLWSKAVNIVRVSGVAPRQENTTDCDLDYP